MLANRERQAIIETMILLENNDGLNGIYDEPDLPVYTDLALETYKKKKINPVITPYSFGQFTEVETLLGCYTLSEFELGYGEYIYYLDKCEDNVMYALDETAIDISCFNLYEFNGWYIALWDSL
ncbi:hypothetical protein [Staphylococcus equorum]|uniref:hypothetical protein n=1 Tax=Staphylococcus equorum TaxID=246432 RepID=UPI0008536EFC|nr:hypothetical protein [Staphylococcus equorum]OEL08286.1 hypothetical protein AST04_08860 [Staphylococcus equorum]